MEDRETPRMHKYGESKTTRIMMATIGHVTAWAGRMKYQAAWFLLNRMYMRPALLELCQRSKRRCTCFLSGKNRLFMIFFF